jgi:hypothetical protein
MATVNKFVLDGETIDIEDATARGDASSAMATIRTVQSDLNEIKELSRLTVTYNSAESSISFSTTSKHD